MEERLSHLILGSFILASHLAQPKPNQAQQAAHLASVTFGLAPFIGSTLRSTVEGVTMCADFALETMKIRYHTQIANIFQNPELMRWIVRQLARKLALARTTDLITSDSDIIKNLKLKAIDLSATKSGLELTPEELLAYYDAGKILDNAAKNWDEFHTKINEECYASYLLDQLLKNILGIEYEKSLRQSLKLVIPSKTSPTSVKDAKNIIPKTDVTRDELKETRNELEQCKKQIEDQQKEIEKLKSIMKDHSHDLSAGDQMQTLASPNLPISSHEMITPGQMIQMFHELTLMQRQTQETQLELASKLEQVEREKEKRIAPKNVTQGTQRKTLFG